MAHWLARYGHMIDAPFAFAGAFTGFVVGLTGVGGGALMTPILLLLFGIAPQTAIATDLWFAAITKIAAMQVHKRGAGVDWQVVRRLWMGSLPVAIVVVALVAFGTSVGNMQWLTKSVGVVVLITVFGLLLSPKLRSLARDRRVTQPEHFKKFQPAWTIAAGALLGLLVALTSVGAGALGTVLLLVLYPLRMTTHKLVASLGMVAEGVPNALSIHDVARKLGVRTPIIDGIYSILYEGKPAAVAMREVLNRDPRPEAS